MTPRPWRLTRRQRVEMEAALASFRKAALQGFGRGDLARAFDSFFGRGRLRCGDDVEDTVDGMCAPLWRERRGPSSVHIRRDMYRTLCARVAIALRAALRADEDARCEEALEKAGAETRAVLGEPGPSNGRLIGICGLVALATEDAMREWLALLVSDEPAPLALWERKVG